MGATRRLLTVGLLLGLCACSDSALPPSGSSDLRSVVDLTGGGDLGPHATDLATYDRRPFKPDMAGFCGDPSSPRIELNGMLAASPFVTGAVLPLGCCDAAEFQVLSDQIATPIVVAWRHFVGQGPPPPITLDLVNLPTGWAVSVFSGCTSSFSGCRPTDRLDAGFTGTLTIAGSFGAHRMSACLAFAGAGGDPHPVIHMLQFWSPLISTR